MQDLLQPEAAAGFQCMRCPLRDVEEEDITPHFATATAFLQSAAADDGKTLGAPPDVFLTMRLDLAMTLRYLIHPERHAALHFTTGSETNHALPSLVAAMVCLSFRQHPHAICCESSRGGNICLLL